MTARCSSRTGGKGIPTRWLIAMLVAVATLLATATVAAAPVKITVVEDKPDSTVLRYEVINYDLLQTQIGADTYSTVRLGKESPLMEAGAPSLPTVNRSLLIGSDAEVEATVVSASYHDVPLIDVTPSKGIIFRTTDPSTVPGHGETAQT